MSGMKKRKQYRLGFNPDGVGFAIVLIFAVYPACGTRPGLDPADDAGTGDAITHKPCSENAGLQPGAAWPMYLGCPERRSRSAAVGPDTPDTIRYIERDEIDFMGLDPVIGADGTVYIGSFYAYFDGSSMFGPEYCVRRLHAFNPDGTEKWVFESLTHFNDNIYFDPGSDDLPTGITLAVDRIYFALSKNCGLGHEERKPDAVMAIDYDGNEIWNIPVGSRPSNITVDPDGNIYFLDENNLFSVAPDGIERWSTYVDVVFGYPIPLLYGQNRIFGGGRDIVFSLNTEGDFLWQIEFFDFLTSAMSFGDNGIIYVSASVDMVDSVYALSMDGKILWSRPMGEGYASDSLSLGSDGMVVRALENQVFAFSSDGERTWNYVSDVFYGGPVVDGEGTVYVVSPGTFNMASSGFIKAIRSDGSLKWETGVKEIMDLDHSSKLAIGADGALYANCGDKLCVIEP